jgi:hypothetical protein
MLRLQAVDAKLFESLLPTRNRWCGRMQTLLDRSIRLAAGQRQNQPRPKYISSRQCARLRPTPQFFTLLRGPAKPTLDILSHSNDV